MKWGGEKNCNSLSQHLTANVAANLELGSWKGLSFDTNYNKNGDEQFHVSTLFT